MFAVKNGILARKRFPPNLKGVAQGTKRKALSVSEVTKILEITRTKYKVTLYTALSLLFLIGMRIGELRALRWEDDIDFENEVIQIRRTTDRFGPGNPKTKNSFHAIPMSKNIKSLLLVY